MKLVHSLCAQTFIVSMDTNEVSAIKIVEELQAVGYPLFVPEISFLFTVLKESSDSEEEKATFTLSLNDTPLFKQKVDITFRQRSRARTMIELHGLLVTGPGELIAKFEAKSETHAEITIPIFNPEEKHRPSKSDETAPEASS